MRFSLYSEVQLHPGKSPEQLYDEVLEQMVNADRLGYDVYAVIEHYFFPKFSISANPTALFAAAAQRTKRINFRTMLHALPFHNPTVLASRDRRHGHPHAGPLRVRGRTRPRLDPDQGGRAARRARAAALRGGGRPALRGARERAVLPQRQYFQVGDSHIIPFPERKFRVTLGGTSDRTYELAAEHGWAVAVPPLLPYAALEKQLDLYREKCAEFGTEPDIVWIHAVHLDDDRETAMREAKEWMLGFIDGNSSPLIEYDKPPKDDLIKADYGFYTAGIMESLDEIPFEQLVADDYVWVGTPDDVIERIEATLETSAGISEIGITVNAGGADHWQAIKNQELFASRVVPHFAARARESEAVGV